MDFMIYLILKNTYRFLGLKYYADLNFLLYINEHFIIFFINFKYCMKCSCRY